MPQERNFCLYCHTNKSNGKRYVGITCRTPEERWRNGTQYYHNEHFYIMSFRASKEAAQYVGRKTTTDILRCCSGKRNSAGGYKWRYLNDEKLAV